MTISMPARSTHSEMPDGIFPKSKRYLYTRTPLVQVVCQVRFQPILKIESDVPAEFQDRIRPIFPAYQRIAPQLPIALPPNVASMVGLRLGSNTHQFATEDNLTVVALAPESLTIATTSYQKWEWFRDLCGAALSAFGEIYQPKSYMRVALRYTDLVVPLDLDPTMEPRSWSAFFNPVMLGELSDARIESSLGDVAFRMLRLRLPGTAHSLLFRHGFGAFADVPIPADRPAYILDFDFSCDEKTEQGSEWPIIEEFHDYAGRAFHWAITQELHELLGPSELRGKDT